MNMLSMNRFALSPFALFIQEDENKDDKVIFKENVTAVVSIGRTTDIWAHYAEQLSIKKAVVPIGVLDSAKYNETITGNFKISMYLIDKAFIYEEINQKSAIGAIHNTSVHFLNEVNATIFLGSSMRINAAYMETINGKLAIGHTQNNIAYFTENLGSNINIFHLTTEILEILVAIPPNGKVEINVADYTAWLNGTTNILHLINGDWANINRDTRHIEIEGAVNGTILYTARWL